MLPRPTTHSKALGPGVAGPELAVATSAVLDRPPQPTAHHPLTGAQPCFVDPAALGDPRQHTKYPYVTGSSVVAIKYKDGVLVGCDMLGAYGSTKRYKSTQRIHQVNSKCVVAAGGEVSDFQHIITLLDELTTDDYRTDDGIELTPQEVYSYLCRVMYNRRNKFDPLWNSLVVGGVQGGVPFLGMVGMIGTHYTDSHVTTGFANQLARPLFRERQHDDMSEEDALALMYDALKVCYYRDKVSINKFQIAKVTKDAGTSISEPFALEMRWDYKLFAQPTKWAVGAW
ncbi:Proteasome subunit beta type-4 [Tetrabaena socialis]|uniref:Proteasome subunit beta n=1 Tax=Tetrabaena socialis TaxID=47790 RepID=A0A2J8ACI9_9CHLO|nr:Proteasome subunit beta type-4 [Tetrabaena socialis]|eukprot:PNH10226.1 Proteasome subunit beta type-4 [Tetrabaena socialis]